MGEKQKVFRVTFYLMTKKDMSLGSKALDFQRQKHEIGKFIEVAHFIHYSTVEEGRKRSMEIVGSVKDFRSFLL